MIMEKKTNKILENLKRNKKLIISLTTAVVLSSAALMVYSNYQEHVKQQEIAIAKSSAENADKNQVDKLFEGFDLTSDEVVSKLKEISKTELKTDEGKSYLKIKSR